MRHQLRTFAQRFGLDVRPYYTLGARRAQLLKDHAVSGVVDVGANLGQYGLEIRRFGYRSPIISFEPLSAAYSKLVELTAQDEAWACHRIALGETEERMSLGVASNLASSSLLLMLDLHRAMAPTVEMVGAEEVMTKRLDFLDLNLAGNLLLKLDGLRGSSPWWRNSDARQRCSNRV